MKFTKLDKDYDDNFLLRAYERCHGQKEWPSYESEWPLWCNEDDWPNCTIPLLISECRRLTFQWTAEEIYNTHPCNMLNIDVRVIELVGTIVNRKRTSEFFKLDVYDGTGIMKVIFMSMEYKRLKLFRKELDKNYGIMQHVRANAPRLMNQTISGEDGPLKSIRRRRRFQVAYRAWWKASSNGMLGKSLKVGDYVNVFGFCALKHRHPDNSTLWNLSVLPKVVFVPVHIDVIDEGKFENKFQEFIDKGMEKYARSDKKQLSVVS